MKKLLFKIKQIIKLVKNFREFRAVLAFPYDGYLADIGWFNSFNEKSPIDKFSKPLPWMTYPFIEFITNRLKTKFTLFEYGTGNSTFFWANKIAKVYSVEHNQEWYKKIIKSVPNNVIISLETDDYHKSINKFSKKFNIISIDGIERIECMLISVNFLEQDGVIILDDSDRVEYQEGINSLLNLGFNKLDFWGLAPCFFNTRCTTILYRDNNCLGI